MAERLAAVTALLAMGIATVLLIGVAVREALSNTALLGVVVGAAAGLLLLCLNVRLTRTASTPPSDLSAPYRASGPLECPHHPAAR